MKFYKIARSQNDAEYQRRYDVTSDFEAGCSTCKVPPGMRQPPICLIVKGTPLPDIIVLSPQELIVTNHVKDAVQAASLTGVQCTQFQRRSQGGPGRQSHRGPIPAATD
jgi:hypothetical protein